MDVESINDKKGVQNGGLQQKLENRHIQLIAIGGAIGTGLFMGSGKTIHLSGSSIILTYMIVGFFMFLVMRALGELLLSNSNYHSFADFTGEYLGSWTGFFIGWTYWLSWVVACVGDVVVIGGYIQYWFPDIPLWIPAFSALTLLVLLNAMSVKAFGEAEFWFSIIKVCAIVLLIAFGLWMILTGFKSSDGVEASFRNVVEPGVIFPNGALGFIAGFQIAIFSFIGIELVGVTAAETKNPERNLPRAINSIPIRIMLFYVLSLICIISVTSWHYVSPDKSPFVELFTLSGLPAAAAVINFVVLTSAFSSANSGVFSTSRMLFGLAWKKQAPDQFKLLSKANIPLRGLLISGFCMFAGAVLLIFIPNVMTLFTLLSTLSAILLIFIWSLIMLAYLSYRKKRPDLHKKSIYKMPAGKLLSWSCLAFFGFVLIAICMKQDTRVGLYLAPIWFVWLMIAYRFKDRINTFIAGKKR
ncbi:amino acid permease [Acinetobacter soli]|uniref:amino acid permease n=1 Tax=Acinetobacter soli TaxID=487316 RepID=UPI0032B455BE